MTTSAQHKRTTTARDHADFIREYAAAGEARALTLGNRGPLRYNADGSVHQDILDAYWTHGFYVFEGLVDTKEVAELQAEIVDILERAPVRSGSDVDAQGRPAFGSNQSSSPFLFIKPLSDPWGGTELLGGRHPVAMQQPQAEQDAPDEVVHLIGGMCRNGPAGLRLYGHADLLSIAQSINGADFVPYNDATFVKHAGLGGSVSWHQDGVTHWESADWDEGIHGFNFQVQLYACTAANALWVVPGSHKQGRIDIKALLRDNDGDERLGSAVPLLCEPGDVTVANRQVLHGSFANSSPDRRISLTFGFHRRRSVLGARGALSQSANVVYDEAHIEQRSALIPIAVDARVQHDPSQRRFVYAPFSGREQGYRYNDANVEKFVKNYTRYDISI